MISEWCVEGISGERHFVIAEATILLILEANVKPPCGPKTRGSEKKPGDTCFRAGRDGHGNWQLFGMGTGVSFPLRLNHQTTVMIFTAWAWRTAAFSRRGSMAYANSSSLLVTPRPESWMICWSSRRTDLGDPHSNLGGWGRHRLHPTSNAK